MSQLRARLERAGKPLLDLTCSNPTRCGFLYEPEFYRGLVDEQSALYEPAALGLAGARRAVAAYYQERGRTVDPGRIWLAAGTSELYGQLLALLCDSGDQVLVPAPGYPLLSYLADVAGVRLVPYPLAYDGAWRLDGAALERALSGAPRPRAIVALSPGHPTGHVMKTGELELLQHCCAVRGLPLILDEVFADYPLATIRDPAFHPVRPGPCLTFVLSGLSKVALLPQLKLSWGVAAGPAAPVAEALARLEILADATLSAATPVQLALHGLLKGSRVMRARVLERCMTNLALLRDLTRDTAVSLLHVEGGWCALLRLPDAGCTDDEQWALRLLQEGVVVQPGHFFDFPSRPPHLALSLLTPTTLFGQGLERVLAAVRGSCSAPQQS